MRVEDQIVHFPIIGGGNASFVSVSVRVLDSDQRNAGRVNEGWGLLNGSRAAKAPHYEIGGRSAAFRPPIPRKIPTKPLNNRIFASKY
jgi:hypothetical protein